MSTAPTDARDTHNDPDEPSHPSGTGILHREVRRDGKVIAQFSGVKSETGITVETRIFPATGTRSEDDAINRPFTFTATEHARAFVDEALVALEYLGCTVT